MKLTLLGNGNTKLKDGHIYYFSLPARIDICGRECPGCYAKKGHMAIKKIQDKYNKNYLMSIQDNFVETFSSDIEKIKDKVKAIRLHDSGEFYSNEYVNKIITIVKKYPNIKFYSYTKRLNEIKNLKKLAKLKNFVLIDSEKFGKINYFKDINEINRIKNKYKTFICPYTLGKNVSCGNGCNYCLTKTAQYKGVIFKKH